MDDMEYTSAKEEVKQAHKDEEQSLSFKYMEMDLFKDICVTIASKDLDITASQMVQYASSVCDGFRERFIAKK
jgi:hypothetical protein